MTKSFTLRLCHEDLVVLARKSVAAEVSGLNDLSVASVSLRDLTNTGACVFCAAPHEGRTWASETTTTGETP